MQYKCDECETELPQGTPVIRVEEGVIGSQGFRAFDEETRFFDNEDCLCKYFCTPPSQKLPRKIP